MVDFTRERRVQTSKPTVSVDPLPIGRYVFALVVADSGGNKSVPTKVEVVVERDLGPGGGRLGPLEPLEPHVRRRGRRRRSGP